MLIKQNLVDKINEQIGNELAASLQYLAIAVYFEGESLERTAGFFYKQSEEEREHAMKLLKYLVDTGAKVVIPTIPGPKKDVTSAEDAFQTSLDWEMEVTGQINGLMDIAVKNNDYLSQNFLNWFVDEQLEEVTTMQKYLDLVRKMGPDKVYQLESFITHPEA